ncbi:hypothetical protein JIN84_10050 [Luteolibacter yonseiensis]|uniref:TIGR02646 family protein n=1 Tax=Luteolibacter yonseiensis TaxID=1144680 RepID=A0A934V7B4_9BACT|nr:hypothetical protein [Luteolibacter yonseiensis]MBK1815962.1 hypothetical protein [Luteolibacter yonseiensis]
MRKQVRQEEPPVLKNGAVTWAASWSASRSEGKPWRWPVKDGIPVNQWILEPLRIQTASHCSFCDGFPVAAVSIETIEHFHPKSTFPEKAFEWGNLFYCCTRCQGAKKERFDPGILKPDEGEYDFARYFIFDYTTGEISPNPISTTEEQQRAFITIEHYKLNDGILPQERRRWLQIRRKIPEGELDDFAYRDFLS